jgi:hypothetical protein
MRPLRVTVLDLVTKGPTTRLYARVMNPNLASIMPQALAVWCEELGHQVRFVCYTGQEDLTTELLGDTDVLFVGAFTRSAQLAYAISNLFRKNGTVTVLGGPHARCFPQDAAKYFDYVLGFSDKVLVGDLLAGAAQQRDGGVRLSARRQPPTLPGVRERWKFIAPTLAKAPALKIVPMIGSMGCPYTCSFCIDAEVDYQPLQFDQIREDLRFVQTQMRRPYVGWHDPNFGVRFDDYMGAIEDEVPAGRMTFVAESSLSLLSEPHLKRLKRNGFRGMLPGVESWYVLGNKSRTGKNQGIDKVRQVAEHVNLVLRYIPFVQTNFVLGLDCDEGEEPFELTKRFIDLTPGAFPAFSLCTVYGQGAPMNLALQKEGRVLPTPFAFLDSNHATNMRPKNYRWEEFFRLSRDLTHYALSWPRVAKRFAANRGAVPAGLNFLRAVTSSRPRHYDELCRLLAEDGQMKAFLHGETVALPDHWTGKIRRMLGALYEHLPEGAMEHDPVAYLKEHQAGPLAAEGAPPGAGTPTRAAELVPAG